MAALDRLDDLEEFLLGHPARRRVPAAARLAVPRRPARLHASRRRSPIGSASPAELGAALAAAEIELVVYATDVSDYPEGDEDRDFELEYSSRTTEPETMGRAILASAAISGLVLPIARRRPDRDGRRLGAQLPVRARVSQSRRRRDRRVPVRRRATRRPTAAFLERTRERLERFRAVPPVRALLAEVRLAQERASRGEPAHYGELIVRLMRVAFARNAVVEERLASERETSVRRAPAPPRGRHRHGRRGGAAVAPTTAPRRARRALRGRAVPVPPRPARPDADRARQRRRAHSLDPTFRERRARGRTELKRALIERGYALTDEALAASARTSRTSKGRQGSGQAVGPHADGVSRPRHAGAVLAASPGGMGAAVRA